MHHIKGCAAENIVTFISRKESASDDDDILALGPLTYDALINSYICPAERILK